MRNFLLAATLLGTLASVGYAQSPPAGQQGIAVIGAWARPSAGAAKTGAAYFTLTDNAAADRLLHASTPVAGKAELHETRNENGIMQMRPVPALALEPGKTVTLAPGGLHVMLLELKQPLKAGDSFPLTLTFETAPPLTVQVNVGPSPGAASMPGMHGSHSMGGDKP